MMALQIKKYTLLHKAQTCWGDHSVSGGWRRFFLLLICLNLIGMLGLGIGAAKADNRGSELVLQPISAEGITQNPLSASPVLTRVDAVITGHIVRTTVIQRFQNPTDFWMQGIYYFPLPDGAAVDRMILKIGDRLIVSEIQEKAAARKIYQEAVKAGKSAALLEQYRPNVFSTRIANIEPGSGVTVELSYQTLAVQEGVRFSVTLPQILTPRYHPAPVTDGQWQKATQPYPEAANIPTNTISEFNIRVRQGQKLSVLSSPSHSLRKADQENGDVLLTLEGGRVPADRDFVLNWKFTQSDKPESLIFQEAKDGKTYILGIVMPPREQSGLSDIARDVTFVLDVSGSMEGPAIEQGKAALRDALDLLKPRDRFQVIAFNDRYTRLFENPRMVSAQNIERAKYYIDQLEAERGTEMYLALKSALYQRREDGLERQIVFLTDGAVTNEEEMFELVDRKLSGARLFTVGLGYAPNSWFMRKAAEFGRGIHIQIDDVSDAGSELAKLFADMARPTLQEIQVQAGSAVTTYPEVMPDLFGQRPIIFLAESTTPKASVTISAIDRQGAEINLSLAVQNTENTVGISKLWASKKVEALLDARARGMGAQRVQAEITAVALTHQIMSPYTSFVAVDKTPVPIREAFSSKAKLGMVVQKKISWTKVQGLQTASPMKLHFWIGVFALALVVAFFGYRMRRRFI